MASAGVWNPILDMQAAFDVVLTVTDPDGAVVPIAAPGFMEIRQGPLPTSPLIARLDTEGSADGTVVINAVAGTVTLHIDSANTALFAAGRYPFDLFVTDPGGQLIRLVKGTITLDQNVSTP